MAAFASKLHACVDAQDRLGHRAFRPALAGWQGGGCVYLKANTAPPCGSKPGPSAAGRGRSVMAGAPWPPGCPTSRVGAEQPATRRQRGRGGVHRRRQATWLQGTVVLPGPRARRGTTPGGLVLPRLLAEGRAGNRGNPPSRPGRIPQAGAPKGRLPGPRAWGVSCQEPARPAAAGRQGLDIFPYRHV
jgi:hypothetical protein